MEGEENTFSSPASIQEVVKSAPPWKRSPKKPNTVLHKDPFVKRTGSFFMPESGCRQKPENEGRCFDAEIAHAVQKGLGVLSERPRTEIV